MVAEDITQNVFLKLYENFDQLRDKESANFWIFRSARNKNKRNVELSEPLISTEKDKFELESYIELKEIKSIVLSELNKMAYDQKEVYLLKEYGGLSYKEIAETLEIDENLVKSRLYKIRQKLINKISKLV